MRITSLLALLLLALLQQSDLGKDRLAGVEKRRQTILASAERLRPPGRSENAVRRQNVD